ncbi:hypothetical protein ID856_13315 [Xenorhabdus sp. 18]|uniref:hypothetical protein n=1 Tax=Xenorhabdus doucetiae TaxID=351671 RepID=UPI0019AF3DC8|nr:hypothetical protein [Xenorhabdus sp. 18]MBD2797510.1 hypothetical protein [Xenorhabdus sp. 18]
MEYEKPNVTLRLIESAILGIAGGIDVYAAYLWGQFARGELHEQSSIRDWTVAATAFSVTGAFGKKIINDLYYDVFHKPMLKSQVNFLNDIFEELKQYKEHLENSIQGYKNINNPRFLGIEFPSLTTGETYYPNNEESYAKKIADLYFESLDGIIKEKSPRKITLILNYVRSRGVMLPKHMFKYHYEGI